MSRKIHYRGEVVDMTEKQVETVKKFITKCRYCVCGTINKDKGIHLSILTTQQKQELNELWFITRTSTQKVLDIEADPRCELLYTDNDNQVSLTGKAEIVKEKMLKKLMSNIWAEKYIPEGPESDEMSLIKFIPEKINAIIV